METILIIEYDPAMLRGLKDNFEYQGYGVLTAADGEEGLNAALDKKPDLILLDIMLPKINGYEICRLIRQEKLDMPIIMLTAKGEESDIVLGLNLGADDYVTKPFGPRELSSRIKAVLRRSEMPGATEQSVIKVDDRLQIDFNLRQVIVDGQVIKLRPTEYRLLYHLVNNAGWTMPHETLLAKVWGHEYRDETHYLRLYITYLRQKIEKDPANPQYILTERGLGYRFEDFKGRHRDRS